MDSNRTDLRLEAERTLLSSPAAAEVVIAVGVDRLADHVFLHEPPTPVELERGIDVIEDALMAAGLPHLNRDDLATSDAHLESLFGPASDTARVSLAEVEALFQRMAAVSLGSPVRAAEPAFTRSASAALLILRECMHHLGYPAVWISRS